MAIYLLESQPTIQSSLQLIRTFNGVLLLYTAMSGVYISIQVVPNTQENLEFFILRILSCWALNRSKKYCQDEANNSCSRFFPSHKCHCCQSGRLANSTQPMHLFVFESATEERAKVA